MDLQQKIIFIWKFWEFVWGFYKLSQSQASKRVNFPEFLLNISRILQIGDIYSQCFMGIRVKLKSKETLSYHVMEYVGYYLKSLPWRPIFEQYSRVMQKPVQQSDGYTKFELLWGKFKSAHFACVLVWLLFCLPSLKFIVWLCPLGFMFWSSETKKFISF